MEATSLVVSESLDLHLTFLPQPLITPNSEKWRLFGGPKLSHEEKKAAKAAKAAKVAKASASQQASAYIRDQFFWHAARYTMLCLARDQAYRSTVEKYRKPHSATWVCERCLEPFPVNPSALVP